MMPPPARAGLSLRTSDPAVQGTNDDATVSKVSCAKLGYIKDDFLRYFVRRPSRRPPMINRGYYARISALRNLIDQFLAAGEPEATAPTQAPDPGPRAAPGSPARPPAPASLLPAPPGRHASPIPLRDTTSIPPQPGSPVPTRDSSPAPLRPSEVPRAQPVAGSAPPSASGADSAAEATSTAREGPAQSGGTGRAAKYPKQILSLGAGFDTLYFQLAAEGRAPARFIEVDFAEVTRKKTAVICAQAGLRDLLVAPEGREHPEVEQDRILSKHYSLVPADLRQLDALEAALDQAGFDKSAPTLVLAECVLVYLAAADSARVLEWAGAALADAVFVVYEMIRPDDAFGQQMLLNLESRGCALLGIHATPDLDRHRRRFQDSGWERAEGLDMKNIYYNCLDPKDVQRVERLELLDELEEWYMIMSHYCIVYGIKDSAGLFKDLGFKIQR